MNVNVLRSSFIGGYNKEVMRTRRLFATSRLDGEEIPISLAFRARAIRNGTDGIPRRSPCVLMAYGAYGVTMEPEFSAPVVSLLERDVVFAIAHIRGGGEFGGRHPKQQAVDDLIDVVEFLTKTGIIDPHRIGGWCASAGAAIFASTSNQRPSLFSSIAMTAPFLDVLTEMRKSDDELPLCEKEEWFDLNSEHQLQQALAFDPMSIPTTFVRFPRLLLIAYKNDPRSPPSHAISYAQKMRKHHPSHPIQIIEIEDAGHSGPSDPFHRNQLTATILTFFLNTLSEQTEPQRVKT